MYPDLLPVKRLCSIGYVQNNTPSITRTLNFCNFCTFMHVEELLQVLFCTPVAQYAGYGYTLVEIPGCGYGYGYGTPFMCLPGISVDSVRLPYPYPELLYVIEGCVH